MTIDTLGGLSGGTGRGPVGNDTTANAKQHPAGIRPPVAATQTPDAVKAKAVPVPMDELKDAVGKLNASMRENGRSLEFSIDEDSKRTVVKLIDVSTKEVVRQYPTEEALRISKSLDSFMGRLIHQAV
jgi:flagellar protein FlaG